MFLEFAIPLKSMIHGLFIQDETGSDFAILIPNTQCAKQTSEFTYMPRGGRHLMRKECFLMIFNNGLGAFFVLFLKI